MFSPSQSQRCGLPLTVSLAPAYFSSLTSQTSSELLFSVEVRRTILMIGIVCHLGYFPPHRNQVQKELKRIHAAHSRRLKDTLKSVISMALTSDFWSDRHNRSFLCITGHYIDSSTTMRSLILHFHSFDERHHAENIAADVGLRLRDLNIQKKITTVTCDGAFNMRNAFDSFDGIDRLWCVAHRMHLVICNGLGLWKKKKKQNAESSESNQGPDNEPIGFQTPLNSSQQQDDGGDEDIEMDSNTESNSPQHWRIKNFDPMPRHT